jgi:hypothetical protein
MGRCSRSSYVRDAPRAGGGARRQVAAAHGLDADAANSLTCSTIEEVDASAVAFVRLLGAHAEQREQEAVAGPDLFADAAAAKARRKRELVAQLAGRLAQPRDEAGRFAPGVRLQRWSAAIDTRPDVTGAGARRPTRADRHGQPRVPRRLLARRPIALGSGQSGEASAALTRTVAHRPRGAQNRTGPHGAAVTNSPSGGQWAVRLIDRLWRCRLIEAVLTPSLRAVISLGVLRGSGPRRL